MFKHKFSKKLIVKLKQLKKKDSNRLIILRKKIKQIVLSDDKGINSYKNLRYELKQCKRVHIDKHFVLTFIIFKEQDLIVFEDFDHHTNIYE